MSYNAKEHKLAKKSHKNHLRKKWLVIILGFIITFAIGVAGSWLYTYLNNPLKTQKNAPVVTVSEPVYEAQKLADSGNIEAAKTAYDSAAKEIVDPVQKSAVILSKANLYYNNGDYDGALEVALAAESVNKSSMIEQYIAQIYEKKNDSENAIKYYQNAIKLVDSSSPMGSSDIQYYNYQINSLSGSGN